LKEITPSPEITFQKLGLRSRGIRSVTSVEAAYAELSAAARFRNALEELGGLFTAFGQFLTWRADLLSTDYLGRLRQLKVTVAPVPFVDVTRTIASELGANENAVALAQGLEPRLCWNTMARCAYHAQYRGRAIAVQVARDPIPDSAFDSFEAGVRLIEDEKLSQVMQPAVLAGFREWMRLSDSPARERSYLAALESVRERTLVQYPVLIPEISTEKLLCFEWVEGETIASSIAHGSAAAVSRVAECVLEQDCSIAAIDGDFDPESMVLTASGKLALRRANRLLAIPPALTNTCLKYISAVLASNAPAAAQMLVKLASNRPILTLEERLLDALSSLEPELKINVQFPPSASIFEGNWRALKRTGVQEPLFLDILHRNLIAVGYWNAETAAPPLPPVDLIAEAQWPVLSRVLRTRLGDLARRETASDWFVGSGLVFFEAMRQVNRLAEGLRENDISLGVDVPNGDEDDERKAHKRIRLGILIGMLFVLFLACLRFAVSTEGVWSVALSMLAIASGFALFWFVSRFD
jgi:hypothetical protein